MAHISKIIFKLLLGGVVIAVINFMGAFVGFHIALNLISSLVTGFLWIPGLLLLVILNYLY